MIYLLCLLLLVQDAAARDWRTLSSDLFKAIDECDTTGVMKVSEANAFFGQAGSIEQPLKLVARSQPLCNIPRKYGNDGLVLYYIPIATLLSNNNGTISFYIPHQ